MQKWFLVLTVVLMMGFYSCTKDKTTIPQATSCSGVNSATNTYNLKVKAILDYYCGYAGCHDAGTATSNVILDSYASSKTSFQNTTCMCAIKQQGGCIPMPQGSGKLADSLITYIECWANNGYPQ